MERKESMCPLLTAAFGRSTACRPESCMMAMVHLEQGDWYEPARMDGWQCGLAPGAGAIIDMEDGEPWES